MRSVRVDILLPVLGRPRNAQDVVQSIRATTSPTVDAHIVFIASPGDDEEIAAANATDADMVIVAEWEPGPGDYARKINLAYRHTDGDWLFTGADDLIFHDGWCEPFLDMAHTSPPPAVVGTNDLCNPLVMRGGHSTHSFVARRYVDDCGATFHDGPGVVLHEGYDHQWIDNELVQAAQTRSMWAFAPDCVIEHLHPLCGKSPRDATYVKAMAKGAADRWLFRKRSREFFRFRRVERIR